MRWSIGTLQTRRGAGLGNEVFAWAKAYLGAQAFGLKTVAPPWMLNRRRYDQILSAGGVGDTTTYLALSLLPSFDIDETLFSSCREQDYLKAMSVLRASNKLPRVPVLKHSSGMAGGYLAIRRARPFLQRQVLGARGGLAAEAIIGLDDTVRLRVGVHIRGGDFSAAPTRIQNAFNVALPLTWYERVVQSLAQTTSLPVDVFLVSDAPTHEMIEALTVHGRPPVTGNLDASGDLALLASCDLIVSSVSSFSLLAIFLGEGRYVWHVDQLGNQGGWRSIWGHEASTISSRSTRLAQLERASGGIGIERGIAQGNNPRWNARIVEDLERRALLRNWVFDLSLGGVVDSRDS